MRYARTKKIYETNTNQNHAAYKKGICCEVTVLTISTIIYKLSVKQDKIYLAISDLDKAFDKVNRNGIIIKLFNIKITRKKFKIIDG